MEPWQTEGKFTFPPTVQPPRLKLPILMGELNDNEMNVVLLSANNGPIYEGTPMPIQPVLRVTFGSNNTPVAGVSCIASLISKNGHVNPRGYRLKITGKRCPECF